MLNVETKFGAFCIWSIIALLCVISMWSIFSWPEPSAVWANAIQSETALIIERFQTLIGLVVGLGAFSLAYLCNGNANRQSAAKLHESKNQDILAALSTELSDLTIDCNEKAQEAWMLAQQLEEGEQKNARDLGLPEALFKSIASPLDTTLMDLAPEDIAPLGRDVYSHIRRLRQELRYIEDVIDQVPDEDTVMPSDQAAFFKELAKGYMTMSQACAHVKGVCEGKQRQSLNGACCSHGTLIDASTPRALEDLRA